MSRFRSFEHSRDWPPSLTHRPFGEDSLLCMMEDCLFGLVHLQEHNMVHADLRPELVGVPVQRGHGFRLLDRLGDPSPPNQVQLNNLKAGKSVYMSPALFHALSSREPKVRHNPFKSDVFSLGMVLLEAGLLESVQTVYNSSKGDIDHEVLVDLVEKFFMRYPRNYILQEVLLVMLEFSEALRQEPAKLLRTLQSLRVTQLEDSHLLEGAIGRTHPENGAMEKVRVTSNGFQVADTNLVNLSILHGLHPSQDQVFRENSFKRSLVEMLRNRNSHNVSGQVQLSRGPQERVESVHSGTDPLIYRNGRPGTGTGADQGANGVSTNGRNLHSNRQTNLSEHPTGIVESQLTKRVDLDSNRGSLNGHAGELSRGSQNSRKNIGKINGLVVRRVSNESRNLSHGRSTDRQDSFDPSRFSGQQTKGSIAVDTKLSHIPEENLHRSHAKSGVQDNDPHAQDQINQSQFSRKKPDQASVKLGASLRVPSKVDPNESLQIIESQISELKQRGSSKHPSFSNEQMFLLYSGPSVLLQNYEHRFCDSVALEALNKVNNADNLEVQGKQNTRLSENSVTLKTKVDSVPAKTGAEKKAVKTQSKDPSFGSLAKDSRLSGEGGTFSHVRRITINHESVKNSFGVAANENGRQELVAKTTVDSRPAISFGQKEFTASGVNTSRPNTIRKIRDDMHSRSHSNVRTLKEGNPTSQISGRKRQSPVVRTIRRRVSSVSRDLSSPKFAFSDRTTEVDQSIRVNSKIDWEKQVQEGLQTTGQSKCGCQGTRVTVRGAVLGGNQESGPSGQGQVEPQTGSPR